MYACAELFCVLTNARNKYVFRRFPLRGALAPSAPLRAHLNMGHAEASPTGAVCFQRHVCFSVSVCATGT